MMRKLPISVVIILSLLAVPHAFADTWKGPKDYYGKQHGIWTLYQGDGKTKKVLAVVPHRHGKMHGAAKYFYASGKKQSTTIFKDGEHNGAYASYYDNKANSFKEQGQHKDNQRTGKWTIWHENGEKKTVLNYFNGKYNGPAQGFYASGHKYYTTLYKDGQHNGAYVGFFDNGDNSKQYQGQHVGHKRTGPWTEWHPNGQPKSILNYFNGKKHGRGQHFYLSGQKSLVTHYRDDLHHGPFSEYFDNYGNVRKFQGAHKNNKRQGPWTEWHELGKKVSFVNYQDGKKHGPAQYYSSYDGDLDYTTFYKGDQHHGPYVRYHSSAYRAFTPLDAIKGTPNEERKILVKKEYGEHRNGKKEGVWISANTRGETDTLSHWKNGVQNGKAVKYMTNREGKRVIFSEVNYKNGVEHGAYMQYFNNEGHTKHVKGTYVNGHRVGTWVRWFENGNREWKGEYNEKGQKHGLWHEFDEATGKAAKAGDFANGKLRGTTGDCPNNKDHRCKLSAE